MTDSVIWLKTPRPRGWGRRWAVLALLALACSACADQAASPEGEPSADPAPAAAVADAAAGIPATSPPAAAPPGLTPLPSANQVLAAQPIGRADPFAPEAVAPVAAAAAAPPPPPSLPEGFRFSGVLRIGATPQALVQVGDQSGPLCLGARGRCANTGQAEGLLPEGWAVAAIDVDQGRLTLRQGGQTLTVEL